MTIEPKISGMLPTYVDPLSVETHTDFYFFCILLRFFLYTLKIPALNMVWKSSLRHSLMYTAHSYILIRSDAGTAC